MLQYSNVLDVRLRPEDVPGAVLPNKDVPGAVEKNTVKQLKRWLECRNLSRDGNKKDLVDR